MQKTNWEELTRGQQAVVSALTAVMAIAGVLLIGVGWYLVGIALVVGALILGVTVMAFGVPMWRP
jgi:Flp pilus assembly protein TadB